VWGFGQKAAVFLLERDCSGGVLEKSAIDSLTEFRCAAWDEGCEEGVESDVLVIEIKLNVYKRVISTQIMPKPTIGLCSEQL
jgi:hypothetical protein